MTQEQLEQGIASGMVTGLASSLTEAGIGTDQTLDMRKASGTSTSGPTPALYTVLEQQKAPSSDGLAAVDHTYKVPGGQRPANAAARKRCALVRSVTSHLVDAPVIAPRFFLPRAQGMPPQCDRMQVGDTARWSNR